jgi:N6-L-threonylcarbamoyladenine synthase
MRILAIETSCDETAAAVVEDGVKIRSNVVASSTLMHRKYGGVVPEVAAREQLRCILPTIAEALKEANCNYESIDTLAVTVGPGLIGSLLVGVETAKTIAMVKGLPIVPVNHVIAHMYANFIDNRKIEFPAISLVVSGGHTELYLMRNERDLKWLGGTLDDAAGEAFDKTARLLGFGNRGGVAIQEAAAGSKVQNVIKLPRPMMHDESLNFSFSGLKTAVMREWKKEKNPNPAAFAYEIQEAVTDVLMEKTLRAARQYKAKSVLLSGGVAANLRLRKKFRASGIRHHVPPISLCTDNAVYIASYAFFRGKQENWKTITATPDLSVEV